VNIGVVVVVDSEVAEDIFVFVTLVVVVSVAVTLD
jgi:hypothetical protein